jgi:hypothetical protein
MRSGKNILWKYSRLLARLRGAHQDTFGRDPRETIIAIRQAFERELVKPTTEAKGSFAIDQNNA